jgi:hypothetical protein
MHPRDASLGVDLDAAHELRREQDGGVERSHRGRVVAGAVGRDPEPVAAREVDDFDDVLGVGGPGHQRPALVSGQVPGSPGLVPRGVGW